MDRTVYVASNGNKECNIHSQWIWIRNFCLIWKWNLVGLLKNFNEGSRLSCKDSGGYVPCYHCGGPRHQQAITHGVFGGNALYWDRIFCLYFGFPFWVWSIQCTTLIHSPTTDNILSLQFTVLSNNAFKISGHLAQFRMAHSRIKVPTVNAITPCSFPPLGCLIF